MKSLIIKENRNAYPIITNVSINEIALSPKRPKVEITTPKIISARMINNKVLLGAESQKCPFSLTTNIENMAKKHSISKLKVLNAPLSADRLK